MVFYCRGRNNGCCCDNAVSSVKAKKISVLKYWKQLAQDILQWSIENRNDIMREANQSLWRCFVMPDYIKIVKGDDRIGVWFYNENDKPFSIGEKMCEINENAYMNGYNWDAFFNYYFAENAPDILEGLESDPEAGSYAAYYEILHHAGGILF